MRGEKVFYSSPHLPFPELFISSVNVGYQHVISFQPEEPTDLPGTNPLGLCLSENVFLLSFLRDSFDALRILG